MKFRCIGNWKLKIQKKISNNLLSLSLLLIHAVWTEDFQNIQSCAAIQKIYLFKVNNRNTRTICEICSNLTIKTPKNARLWISKYRLGKLVLTLSCNLLVQFLKRFYHWSTLVGRIQIATDAGSLHKKFSIKEFFSKCDQIRSFLGIWSHLLKKSLMEIFIFCAVDPMMILHNVSDVRDTSYLLLHEVKKIWSCNLT